MKKKLCIAVLSLLAAVLLVSCACDTAPSPSPRAGATATPRASLMPSASPAPSPETTPQASPEESGEAGGQESNTDTENKDMDADALRAEVEKLSEVKSAVVATMGDTALVGVTFDDAYQGTLTARITEMVTERVQSAEAALTNVRVTADQTLCEEIESFASEKHAAGSTQAKDEFDMLVSKLEPAA